MKLASRSSMFALASLLGVAACTAPTDATDAANGEVGQTDDELVGGTVDAKDSWSVGICSSELNTDPKKGKIGACVEPHTRCSGSLIAPNVVLTARHCVRQIDYADAFCDSTFNDKPLSSAKIRVTRAASVLDQGAYWRDVERVLTPSSTRSACEGDIALLVLKNPIPGAQTVKVDLDTNLTAKHPTKLTVVGRGMITNDIDLTTLEPINEQLGGAKKRVLENIPFLCVSDIDNTCTVEDATSPPSNVFALPAAFFLTGPGIGSGDSGSGVLDGATYTAHDPVLIGVNVAGTFDTKTGHGNAGLAIRIARHKTFVVGAVAWAAAKGGYAIPAWARFADGFGK